MSDENESIEASSSHLFATRLANEPVRLYDGAVVLNDGTTSVEVFGRILLQWIPRPNMTLILSGEELLARVRPLASLLFDGGHTIPFELNSGKDRRTGLGSLSSIRGRSGTTEIGIRIGRLSAESAQRICQLNFHIVNFPDFREDAVEGQRGYSLRLKPITLKTGDWTLLLRYATSDPAGSRSPVVGRAGGWTATIDQSESLRVGKALDETGGFAITHWGTLSKADGQLFSGREGLWFLVALELFLSFARGSWISLTLPSGLTDASLVWESWSQPRNVDAWQRGEGTGSWGTSEAALNSALSSFVTLWSNKDWRYPFQTSVEWFIEASNARSPESALMGSQSALELLARIHLVEKTPLISPDGFDKLSACDKIKLLLSRCLVPFGIPEPLKELIDFSRDRNREWKDGPRAITEFRNGIAHPKGGRAGLRQGSSLVRTQAAALSLWYLEMVLLWTIDYRGLYWSRWSSSSEFVPWNRPSADGVP